MWRRLWVGKRVEGEIENFPKLDRAGQRGRGKTKKTQNKTVLESPQPQQERYTPWRVYRGRSIWIRGRRKINGDYFPLINWAICSLLQREDKQITYSFYSIYLELSGTLTSPLCPPSAFTPSVDIENGGCPVQTQPWKCLQSGGNCEVC